MSLGGAVKSGSLSAGSQENASAPPCLSPQLPGSARKGVTAKDKEQEAGGWVRAGGSQIPCFSKNKQTDKGRLENGSACAHQLSKSPWLWGHCSRTLVFCPVPFAFKAVLW